MMALACALSVFAGHSLPQDDPAFTNAELSQLVRQLSERVETHEELLSRTLPPTVTYMAIESMCRAGQRDLPAQPAARQLLDARQRQEVLQAVWHSHMRLRGGHTDRRKDAAIALDEYLEQIESLTADLVDRTSRQKR